MLREFVCSFLVLCFSVKVCPSTTIDLQARCVRTAGFLFSHEICFAHDTQGRALSTAPLLDSAPDAEQIKFDRLVNEMRSAHGSVHHLIENVHADCELARETASFQLYLERHLAGKLICSPWCIRGLTDSLAASALSADGGSAVPPRRRASPSSSASSGSTASIYPIYMHTGWGSSVSSGSSAPVKRALHSTTRAPPGAN